MAAVVLTSEDVGAPVLTANNAGGYAFFKAIIPQLGWTIAFDNDVDTIVFRNDPLFGSGWYLRMAFLTSPAVRVAHANLYSSMSDVDTGTLQQPTRVSYWHLGESNNQSPISYRIIGDKRFFYACIKTGISDGEWTIVFAGDLIGRQALAPQPVICSQDGVSSPQYGSFAAGYSTTIDDTDAIAVFGRNIAGTAIGGEATAFMPALSTSSVVAPGSAASGPFVDPITGDSYLGYAWMVDAGANAVRGRLPGSYWPIGDWNSVYPLTPTLIPALSTPDGVKDCWYLGCSSRIDFNLHLFSVLVDIDSADWIGAV